VIQHHQVSVHEVEPVELVTGLLGVHDIVIDHERGALGRSGGARADLANGPEFAEEVEEGGRVDVVGEVLDEEDAVCFWGELLARGHRGGSEGWA
jgi:hypothetical protein